MRRRLTDASTLDNLRKEAKRWLKALRTGDEQAGVRLRAAWPAAPASPGLRDVQHALAREYGLPGWSALRDRLEDRQAGTFAGDDAHALRVAWFLEDACAVIVNGGAARSRRMNAAARLLQQDPAITHDSIHTAVVCGDLADVERIVAQRPEAATERVATIVSGGPRIGPKPWEPLMFLCYARLPQPSASEHALRIAQLLLDHGADANAHFIVDESSLGPRYTALTGVLGAGEENAPPHPHAHALAELLLERGANPYDIQVLYNAHFGNDMLWIMQRIHEYSVKAGHAADWQDPEWSMIDMGGYGKGARYVLGMAVRNNDLPLARWSIEHGASPEPAQPPHARVQRKHTLYEEAARRGFDELASLLAQYGTPHRPLVLEGEDAFTAACLRLDRAQAEILLAEHPEYRASYSAMHEAARRDRADIVEMLLDLGVSPDVENDRAVRPLHAAASNNALRVIALLLARGAAIDPREKNWDNTPLAFAVYEQHPRVVDLLSPVSRDVWSLVVTGRLDRLRELFREEPALARVQEDGHTPLMGLPDDETAALAVIELLLSYGADPAVRNTQGLTATDLAARRGMKEAAARLRRGGDSG